MPGIPQQKEDDRMFDLPGKCALVTGASGGIGGAIARALHAQGAAVTLAGTRRDALDALAGALGSRCWVETAQLADPAAPDALVKAAEAGMGQGDILINKSGLNRGGLPLRMEDEELGAGIQVQLT